MRFGIGKVRPCGTQHVYKYAHAKTTSDMARAAGGSYLNDGDSQKKWHYVLPQLTKLTNAFNTVTYSETIDLDLPEVTEAYGVTSNSSLNCLKLLKLNMPKCTNTGAFAYKMKNNLKTERKIELNLPSTTRLDNAFNETVFYGDSYIKISAPKCTNFNNMFLYADITANCPDFWKNSDICMNSCTTATNAFSVTAGIRLNELTYTVDENGDHAFASGLPAVGRKYTTFPKLQNGTSLFDGARCELTNSYAKAVLDDLPSYERKSDGSGGGALTLRIHKDYKYDPELQTKLKIADGNYTILTEPTEEITKDKGFNVEVKYTDTLTNKCIAPPMADVEFSEIILPEGYTELEYIQSYGDYYSARWIDTEYYPDNETGFYIIGEAVDTLGGGDSHFLGAASGTPDSTTLKAPCWICSCYTSTVRWGNTTANVLANNKQKEILNHKTILRMNFKNDRKAYFKNETGNYYSDVFPEITSQCINSVFIGAYNKNGTRSGSCLNGRIYRILFSQGQEVVRDFVPCLDENGTPCLRDIINNKNYYNKGSGSFVYRIKDKNEEIIPSDYTRLSFLETKTGSSCYIKTDLDCKGLDTVVEWTCTDSLGGAGAIVAGYNDYYAHGSSFNTTGFGAFLRLTNATGAVCNDTQWNSRCRTEINISHGYTHSEVDSEMKNKSTNFSPNQSSAAQPLYLFDRDANTSYYAKAKIYSVKASYGLTPAGNFIPCLDNNGIPCMYDEVTQKSYYNGKTTTSFIAGFETIEKALELRLPSSGGSLKISIPENNDTEENRNSIISNNPNWNFTFFTHPN